MEIKNIIEAFHKTGIISDEVIIAMEDDHDFCVHFLTFFRQNKDREFAIELLNELIKRRKEPNGMSGDSLMLGCYILALHNNIEDSLKIWEVKTIDFDTFCYVDVQLIPFTGIDETIVFLNTVHSKEALDALDYITKCKESGDFENLSEYFADDAIPWYV